MIDIRMPNINGTTDKEQLVQIRSYLYQFAEQLQWALSNVEGGGGSNVVLQQNGGGGGTEKVTDPTNFNELKALIIKSADIVEAYYAAITKLIDERNRYVAQSDFGTFLQETNNALYADGSSFKQVITDLQQIYSSLDEMIAERLVNAYIKSGVLEYDKDGVPIIGVEVGQTTKKTDDAGEDVETFEAFARFTADRLSFYDANSIEVAYISKQKLHITNAKITGNLELGGFILDTSDGLALIPI